MIKRFPDLQALEITANNLDTVSTPTTCSLERLPAFFLNFFSGGNCGRRSSSSELQLDEYDCILTAKTTHQPFLLVLCKEIKNNGRG
ncbi:hypothetical protein QVD17_20873 [Tagetes erecta]|uniref:Uncharacterized protein n=1 Tax=Tagetes erecta TaxID=13708 RepID=A0AAD8NRD9_TARER|nr:hypothetical protein QVD17_20873 [Tagetes erecta]